MLPQKGLLHVRLLDGELTYLFYSDDGSAKPGDLHFHIRNIAGMDYGSGKPWFSGAMESTSEEKSGAGFTIELRPATDDDIRAFLRVWDPEYSIAKWAEGVAKCEGLAEEEKQRVWRIAREFIV